MLIVNELRCEIIPFLAFLRPHLCMNRNEKSQGVRVVKFVCGILVFAGGVWLLITA